MLLLRTASGGFIRAESIVALSPHRGGDGQITWAGGPRRRLAGRAGRLLRHAGPDREVAAEPDLRACSSSPCDLEYRRGESHLA